MKYTTSEIKDLLIKKFKGRPAVVCDPSHFYLDVIKKCLNNLGYDDEFIDKHICWTVDRLSVDIYYVTEAKYCSDASQRKLGILKIEGKRQIEKTRYCNYYSWKDFKVTLYTYTTQPQEENLQDWLARLASDAERRAKLKDDTVYSVFKTIKDSFPKIVSYEMENILERIVKNSCTLYDRYKEEK